MRVMAQLAMVMNLDKCIGCHTCSVTCKQAWTNRPGHRVRLVQQRGDQAGTGISGRYQDQERWKGGWALDKRGRLQLGGRAVAKLLNIFANPDLPTVADYYEPWTYDYENLHPRPDGHHPGARPMSLITGKDMKVTWGATGTTTWAADPSGRDRPDAGRAPTR